MGAKTENSGLPPEISSSARSSAANVWRKTAARPLQRVVRHHLLLGETAIGFHKAQLELVNVSYDINTDDRELLGDF